MIKINTIRTLCVAVAGAFILTTGYATIANAAIVVKKETVIDRNINRGLLASPIAPRVVKEKVVMHRKVMRPRVEIDKKVVVRPRVKIDKKIIVK